MSQRLSAMMSSSSRREMGVDRVVAGELVVEVLGEHLDVAGLVHHLGGGVVLGVDPRHRLDDLGRAHERALLAVHELRERPVLALDAELDPLLVAPLAERRAGDVDALARSRRWHGVGHHQLLLVDLGLPGQVGLAVPLGLLRLLVELVELGTTALVVVPGEDGVVDRVDGVAAPRPRSVLHDGQDGLEIVDRRRGR